MAIPDFIHLPVHAEGSSTQRITVGFPVGTRMSNSSSVKVNAAYKGQTVNRTQEVPNTFTQLSLKQLGEQSSTFVGKPTTGPDVYLLLSSRITQAILLNPACVGGTLVMPFSLDVRAFNLTPVFDEVQLQRHKTWDLRVKAKKTQLMPGDVVYLEDDSACMAIGEQWYQSGMRFNATGETIPLMVRLDEEGNPKDVVSLEYIRHSIVAAEEWPSPRLAEFIDWYRSTKFYLRDKLYLRSLSAMDIQDLPLSRVKDCVLGIKLESGEDAFVSVKSLRQELDFCLRNRNIGNMQCAQTRKQALSPCMTFCFAGQAADAQKSNMDAMRLPILSLFPEPSIALLGTFSLATALRSSSSLNQLFANSNLLHLETVGEVRKLSNTELLILGEERDVSAEDTVAVLEKALLLHGLNQNEFACYEWHHPEWTVKF